MAQASDNTVDNGTGASVRSDINARLAALFTNHSGPNDSAMVTKYPYQFWADTTAQQLKIRNSSDTAWIGLRGLEGEVILPNGTTSKPAIFFSSDADTGIRYNSSYGSVSFVRDTLEHAVFGRSLQGQIDAFVFGSAARQTTSVNPSNGTESQKDIVKGVSIQDSGPVHIGTADQQRPLTLNKMGSYGGNDANADKFLNFNTNGTFRGGISWNGSNLAFAYSSDYRLKENVNPLTNAIERIKLANPITFNYISCECGNTLDGFLAHEIGEVVPQMLHGHGKDALDERGQIDPQGIDLQSLVPLLTAALKESIAKIESLEARVTALEPLA